MDGTGAAEEATALPRAGSILRGAGAADDRVTLDHEGRHLRRRRLVSDGGRAFLVDLPETTEVGDGDAFALDDGSRIAVRAAAEALLEVRGDLPRLAWHIGNRHVRCAVGPDRLLLRDDPVLAEMLRGLGAEVRSVSAAFLPEGGAYGAGPTHGHGEPE